MLPYGEDLPTPKLIFTPQPLAPPNSPFFPSLAPALQRPGAPQFVCCAPSPLTKKRMLQLTLPRATRPPLVECGILAIHVVTVDSLKIDQSG